MAFTNRTTSDQQKPRVFVQPSKTEKEQRVSRETLIERREVSPTVSPTTARRRHAYGPELPTVTLDAALVDLPAALYEELSLLLRKDGAWRKLLHSEGKVTRKMEIAVSNYLEDFENKPGKKAMDILSDQGWTIRRLRDSLYQLGYMESFHVLERVLGAEENIHIYPGLYADSYNTVQGSASNLSIDSHLSIDSEGSGTEIASFPSDQMFGGGDGERCEFRSPATDNAAVQLVGPVSGPFDVENDRDEDTSIEYSLPKLEMLMEHFKEESVDLGQDQAGLNQGEIHQESGVGMCKLLLPKSSMPMPVTQGSFVQPCCSVSEDD